MERQEAQGPDRKGLARLGYGARRRSDNPPPKGPRKPLAPPGAPSLFGGKRKKGSGAPGAANHRAVLPYLLQARRGRTGEFRVQDQPDTRRS
ncbi:MAG: hypothetical protein QOD74_457, partial [Variibacter sp.]|nr:hypothetical protein [Variibacter sp.]